MSPGAATSAQRDSAQRDEDRQVVRTDARPDTTVEDLDVPAHEEVVDGDPGEGGQARAPGGLEAEAVPLVDVREKLPDKKISVDLSTAETAEPSRDHSSAEFATTSVSESEERPLSASLARHRALLEQVCDCCPLNEIWSIGSSDLV